MNKTTNNKTNTDEVSSIIQKSGNNFHCKVLKRFKGEGWNELVSPYYMDNSTNKPREIDLIAEKSWQPSAYDSWSPINIKLFIECKYINQKVVFWFAKKDTKSAENWVISNTRMEKDNGFTQEHHYLKSNEVAKLFASGNGEKEIHNEPIYKALNQCLNSMIALKQKKSIIPIESNQWSPSDIIINYPVIVCNSFDRFYRVEMAGDDSQPEKITKNFQLEVNYVYKNSNGSQINKFFLIDIVCLDYLDDFLKQIENDIDFQK